MALNALSIILGGGMSSRLFQELREKKGLCYTIFSFQQQFSSSGILGIYSACNPKDTDDLLISSLSQIKKLRGNIDYNDLNRAKAQMRANFIRAQDYTFNRLETNIRSLINHGKLFSKKDILEKIDRINISNLIETFDKVFGNPKFVISMIGPEEKKTPSFNFNL